MLNESDLAIALKSTPVISWNGNLYRSVDLKYFSAPYHPPRPLYSLGAPTTGGRFTPRGGPPSLYMAEETLTALAEATLTLPASTPMSPKVVFSANTLIDAVLDLTQASVQKTLGISLKDLSSSWRLSNPTDPLPPTQLLGKAVLDCGRYSAIRYPSTKYPGGNCLVIFADALKPPSFVEVYDPDGILKGRIP